MSATEYRTFQMTDRSTYRGYVLPGTYTPTGWGEMAGQNFTYNGQFKNGQFDGFGTIIYHFIPSTGQNAVHYYEGGFRKGKYFGQGTARYYVPPMQQGYPQAGYGPGPAAYPQRSSVMYSGGWVDGLKSGYGMMMYANGQQYVGGWNNDVQDGYGTCSLDQRGSPRYEGGWKGGMWEGLGKYFGADGTCEHEGGYKANKKEGNGMYSASDGKWYAGVWSNGIKIR
jgi:hypothetical protein